MLGTYKRLVTDKKLGFSVVMLVGMTSFFAHEQRQNSSVCDDVICDGVEMGMYCEKSMDRHESDLVQGSGDDGVRDVLLEGEQGGQEVDAVTSCVVTLE